MPRAAAAPAATSAAGAAEVGCAAPDCVEPCPCCHPAADQLQQLQLQAGAVRHWPSAVSPARLQQQRSSSGGAASQLSGTPALLMHQSPSASCLPCQPSCPCCLPVCQPHLLRHHSWAVLRLLALRTRRSLCEAAADKAPPLLIGVMGAAPCAQQQQLCYTCSWRVFLLLQPSCRWLLPGTGCRWHCSHS